MGLSSDNRNAPLHGLKILELQGIGPGPMAATLLSDLGADVVTITRPGGVTAGLNRPLRYDLLRRNRPRIVLDLKTDKGRVGFFKLLKHADVLIDPFRPGVTDSLGIGPVACAKQNSRLVHACMTGWGQDGPLAKTAGHDINYMAVTGLLNAIGPASKPVPPLNIAADMGGGAMFLVAGILSALFERSISNKGQVVDASIVDGTTYLSLGIFGAAAGGSWNLNREDNILDGGAPYYSVYATSDEKFVAVGAIEDKFFAILLEILDLEPALFSNRENREMWPDHRRRLAACFQTKSRDEWATIFYGTDACVTPVLDFIEAAGHPHNKARATFFEEAGIVQPGPAPRFGRSALADPAAAPCEEWTLSTVLNKWAPESDTTDIVADDADGAATLKYVNRDI